MNSPLSNMPGLFPNGSPPVSQQQPGQHDSNMGTTLGVNGQNYSDNLVNHARSMLQNPSMLSPEETAHYQAINLASGHDLPAYLNYMHGAYRQLTGAQGPSVQAPAAPPYQAQQKL